MDPMLFGYAVEAAAWALVGTGYYIVTKVKGKPFTKKDSKLTELVKPTEIKRD